MLMLKILCEELSRCGLALNANKTKVFTNDTRYSMAEDTLTVPFGEQSLPAMLDTDMHKYFGRELSGNKLDKSNINTVYRMECAWAKYHVNRAVLTDKNISVKLRLRIFDTVVSPTATYGLAKCALTQQ